MSTPPIQSSGPTISPDVPWEIGRHLQLLYQKLGNHTQAFNLQQQQIANLKAGSTTTNIIAGVGGSSPAPPPPPPSTGFLGQGLINNQAGATSYITQPGDNGILLVLNDASPVAVTLTTNAAPFYLIITNFGAGAATLTPSTGTINGGASLSLLQNQTVLASCDSTNWLTTAFVTSPLNTPTVAHEWLNSYNAATGAFTQTQPAFTDLSGVATPSQLPVATTAALGAVKPDGTTITISGGVITSTSTGGGPLLQTNTVNNGSQAKLNLKQGTNVTIVDDGTGGVTVSASTTTVSAYTPRIKSNDYTAIANDAVFMDTSSGGHTVTLPAASANSGVAILVKKTTLDANNLTIARTGADLIDGATSQVTSLPLQSYTFVSDGVSNWWII